MTGSLPPDPLALLDPDAARVIHMITLLGRPPIETLPVAAARAAADRAFASFAAPAPAMAEVMELPASPLGPPVALRLYRVTPRGVPGPAVVFFHGGGWVLGSLDTHEPFCRRLAEASAGTVIAAGYRLAPEHPFPAAVEDALAATCFIQRHATRFGLDPRRLFLAGDSAGGTLAAVTAQALRATGLAGQILLYPATDLARRQEEQPANPAHALLSAAAIGWFKRLYLGPSSRPEDLRASPLRHPDLAGLPPALVITVGQDLLCAEATDYVQALRRAGTPVRHHHLSGQIHGFLTMDRVIAAATPCLGEIAAFVAPGGARPELNPGGGAATPPAPRGRCQ